MVKTTESSRTADYTIDQSILATRNKNPACKIGQEIEVI